MSDSNGTPTPAGWYPDPEGGPRPRWWDGQAWTDSFRDDAPTRLSAYSPGDSSEPSTTVAVETSTAWIWLIVALPTLLVLPLFFIDFSRHLTTAAANPDDVSAQLALYSDPVLLIAIGLSLLITVLLFVFAALDYRTLKRRGLPKPFHWAWMFTYLLLSLNLVYVIGRSVVAHQRTGRGYAPMVVNFVLLGVQIALVVIWAVTLAADLGAAFA